MTATATVLSFALCAGVVGAAAPAAPDALRAEIEALKPAKVAWREIAWKSCLLEGLKQSRAHNKPVLLLIFIDRPCDDARCLVCAGAAYEAVFSKPEAIRRVNADFVPAAIESCH